MRTKTYSTLLIFIILALSLSACTRVASFSPIGKDAPTEDPLENLPILTQAPQTQDALSVNVTDTASTPEAGAAASSPEPTGEAAVQATAVPPTEAAVQTTLVPVRPETYALKPGEWPICIARRYDLNLETFFAVNRLNMKSQLLVGAVLKLPAKGNWSASNGTRYLNAHPAQYTVRPGDNIYTIACYYGDIEPETILAANNLNSSSKLTSGQVLQIP